MTLSQRIFRNIGWLGISEIIIAGSSFVFTFLIAKYFSVEEFGQFNYALILVTTVGVLIELGLTKYVTREVSLNKNHTKKHLLSSIFSRLIFIAPALLVLIATNVLTKSSSTAQLVSLILFGHIVLLYLNHSFYSVYRAHEQTQNETFAKLISATTLLGGGAYLAIQAGSVIDAAWIYLASTGFQLLFNFYQFRKIQNESERLSIDFSFILKSLKESWPFALSTIFAYLYYYIDSLFLGVMKGDESVAFYNIAYKILFIAIIIIGFFYSGLFPIATKYAKEDKELYYKILEKAYKLILSFGILFALGCFFFSADILTLAFEQKYIESIGPTQILGANAIIISFNILLSHLVLEVFNQQKKSTIASGIGAAANIILNFSLIPTLGIIGAAIATIATECIVGALLLYFTNIAPKIKLTRSTALLLLSGVGTFIILYTLKPFIHFALLIGVEVLVFMLMSVLLKAITKEDLRLIKSLKP